MTVTAKDCLAKYGEPEKEAHMTLWSVPNIFALGVIPKRIYCNHDLVNPLMAALSNVIKRDLIPQIRTWDGCFNIRKKRGAGVSPSLHSWGIAIDINAAWNGFGKTPTMTPELVACFTDAGFEWGGNWHHPDGMHMQLAKI